MSAKDKYKYCLGITEAVAKKIEVIGDEEKAGKLLRFLEDYTRDAKHYAEKGDYDTALEAIAYAHGFIDAGVLAELFRVDGYHLPEHV